MSKRYALYFAPADGSPLASFGEAALGRTAARGRSEDADSPHPDRQRWLALTQSPAHYGFHATLKAPFELAAACRLDKLCETVEEFAGQQSPVPLPGLQPRFLAGFTALTLEQQPDALSSLALRIVETFEPFRQPLSASDIQRRKSQPLTARQLELLERFGYPYVAEEFRFHMTLTGAIGGDDQDYSLWLQDLFRQHDVSEPALDHLAIYCQENRAAPFTRLQSYPLLSN